MRIALQRFINQNDLSKQYRVSSGPDVMRIVEINKTFPCKQYENTGDCFYYENEEEIHNRETRYMKCDGCDWKRIEDETPSEQIRSNKRKEKLNNILNNYQKIEPNEVKFKRTEYWHTMEYGSFLVDHDSKCYIQERN